MWGPRNLFVQTHLQEKKFGTTKILGSKNYWKKVRKIVGPKWVLKWVLGLKILIQTNV